MMCYRDMTFCSFYEDCTGHPACLRALTPAIEYEAKVWWGSDTAPICQFVMAPECFESNHGNPVGMEPKPKE